MAVSAVVGVVGLASAAVTYEGNRKAASQAEDVAINNALTAERNAEITVERAAKEEELERERIMYETKLMQERAYTEAVIETENARVSKEQKGKQFKETHAEQLASAAASGVTLSGSTLTVMERSHQEYEDDVAEVDRALSVFMAAKNQEVTQTRESNYVGFLQYVSRSRRETAYSVEGYGLQADSYIHQANNYSDQKSNLVGGLALGVAGAGLKAYGVSQIDSTNKWGMLAGM